VDWFRDRRGYGELRLRLRRREERRAGWLDGQLRQRRRAVWQAHRRLWVSWASGYGLLVVGLGFAAAGHPTARAALLGSVATAAVGTLLFALMLVDGTLLARLGRLAEEGVGDEFRTADGVFGVVSNVPFDSADVDHVVLAHAGVLAVEVKQIHGLFRSLPPSRLAGMLEQTRTGARRTSALLRQHRVPATAWPVLVLTGAGAPDLPGGRQVIDGVTVVARRHAEQWLPRLQHGQRLDRDTARQAADALLAYRTRRWEHERAKQPSSGVGWRRARDSNPRSV
jgi:hypothetical protein